jgi:hypothetical protein
VGELVTSYGNRLISISVHPHRPIMSSFVIVLIINVHPERTFSNFDCPSWRHPEDILVGFATVVRTHNVQLISLVPGVRTFRAVISTERDWDEMGMLNCFH